MKLDFAKWFKQLHEVGTSTACVAQFVRPVGPMVRRNQKDALLKPIVFEDDDDKDQSK